VTIFFLDRLELLVELLRDISGGNPFVSMVNLTIKKQYGHKSNTPLYRVHIDIAGPVTPTSHNGDQCALTFVDDATRFACIYIIKSTDQAFNGFKCQAICG
jgi:hypothetical protein